VDRAMLAQFPCFRNRPDGSRIRDGNYGDMPVFAQYEAREAEQIGSCSARFVAPPRPT
jgi:hypothetical protein